jgi:hypothetical protein
MHVVDHLSSFHFVNALTSKSASEVLNWLRITFQITGRPQIVQSDNGGEFNNHLIRDYFKKWGVTHRNSKPYTPATNGKVERGNADLKEVLSNLMKEHDASWFDVLYEACFIMNTTPTRSLKMSPHEFVFGQKHWRDMNTNNLSPLPSESPSISSSTPTSTPSSPSRAVILQEVPLPNAISSSLLSQPIVSSPIHEDFNLNIVSSQNNPPNKSHLVEVTIGSNGHCVDENDPNYDNKCDDDECNIENVTPIIDILSRVAETPAFHSQPPPPTKLHASDSVIRNAEETLMVEVNAYSEESRGLREKRFKRVRELGRISYIQNTFNMVKQVDNQRGAVSLEEGDVVGVFVPQECCGRRVDSSQ